MTISLLIFSRKFCKYEYHATATTATSLICLLSLLLFLSQLASDLVVQNLVPIQFVACQGQCSTQTLKSILGEVCVAVVQ